MTQGRRFVSYLRVSTQRQGQSGLGIEAQRKAVADYIAATGGKLLAEYVEIESGKRDDNRPKLAEARAACDRQRATLVIARLDRLARNVRFVATLLESKAGFIAVDQPEADRAFLQMAAVFAEWEGRKISERTRAALAAAKARGKPLGWSIPSRAGEAQRAAAVAVERRTASADAFARKMLRTVRSLQRDGVSTLAALADALNGEGHRTARGCQWRAGAVQRLLLRAEGLAPQGGKGAQVAPRADRAAA